MEFTDLIGVCQGFVAGASRLVPKLRGPGPAAGPHYSARPHHSRPTAPKSRRPP
ncbi:hypothetical protein ACR820_00815 [Streptomyces netropsis]